MTEDSSIMRPGPKQFLSSDACPEQSSGSGSKGGPQAIFDPSPKEMPPFLIRLMQAYPYLQRHPHPFLVHFIIVFIYTATFLSLLFLAIGHRELEIAAFYCVGAGLVFLPPVIVSGEISRRVNYSREPITLFHKEIYYSGILFVQWATIFIWRWFDPTILQNFRWLSVLYLLLLFIGIVLVTLISFHGGLLTFPIEKNQD